MDINELNNTDENENPVQTVQEEIEIIDYIKEIKSHNFDELELCNAATIGDFKAVRKLLSENVNINCRNPEGYTPLHLASKFGNYEIVKILLLNGANISVVTADLVTPLHLASFYSKIGVVKLLALSKANLNATTKSGCKPIDLTSYESETWRILRDAANSILPQSELLKETLDLPVIPAFAMKADGKDGDKKKKKKGGKKSGKKGGKKGKKSGKKKGKKKK